MVRLKICSEMGTQQDRIRLTPFQKRQLLAETGDVCPLCGGSIFGVKEGQVVNLHQFAHIYPSRPTDEQMRVLANVEKPVDVESQENIIVLCHDCHKKQDFHTTVEDYERALKVKRHISARASATAELRDESLDSRIITVLKSLASVDDVDLVPLRISPTEVEKKLNEGRLLNKVRHMVVDYFNFIQEALKDFDRSSARVFKKIASQVKTAYHSSEREDLTQEDVFDCLVAWMRQKTRCGRVECEIAVSFFIQNCEVFK